ncbi:MAG TPA: YihY/virulence factor BrkB family protein [Pirellulales bacterium]|jgi:membrane protein|nr:YihY/virulence factor BrkB family protein [Pirellulales bacterium]
MRSVLGRVWAVLSQTIDHWQNDDGLTLAAAVAYYAAFSFLPLVLVLLSGIGFVLRASESAHAEQQAVLDLITQSTSPDFSRQIEGIIETVKNQAPVGGPLGIVTLLLGAMALFAQIDSAFDRIWNVGPVQHTTFFAWVHRVLVDRLKAFLMLLSLGVLVMASFVMGMVLATVATYVPGSMFAQTGWRAVRTLSIVAFNSVLFTTTFKVLPRATVRWRDAAPGGILTAVVWEIGRQVLAVMVIGGRYSAYGVVGTFIAMMVWVYYAAAVLFLGAEFVKVTCDACNPKPKSGPPPDPPSPS